MVFCSIAYLSTQMPVVGWRAGRDYEELAGHLGIDDLDAQPSWRSISSRVARDVSSSTQVSTSNAPSVTVVVVEFAM
jgi:hypothetical protein